LIPRRITSLCRQGRSTNTASTAITPRFWRQAGKHRICAKRIDCSL